MDRASNFLLITLVTIACATALVLPVLLVSNADDGEGNNETLSPFASVLSVSPHFSLAYTPEHSYLTLRYRGQEELPLSGWSLRAGADLRYLPAAAPLFVQGEINPTQNLRLRAGDEVLINFGSSPVGTSFQENVCTALLGRYQRFSPPLVGSSGGQSYNTCVQERKRESGFYLPSWRLYLGYEELLQRGSTIELRDSLDRPVATLTVPE